MITAIVGSGGKTTLLHEMANQYVKEGKKVLVLTTTHMMIEENTLLTDDVEQIKNALLKTGYVMVGQKEGNKITALSEETYTTACTLADEVLIEADGSKQLPLKYPNDTEPVIPSNVDKIIIVCGLKGLGQEARNVVHRLELAEKELGIHENTIISPNDIQGLLQNGYLDKLIKRYPNKEITIHVTHKNSLYERVIASFLRENKDVNCIDPKWFQEKPHLFLCGGGHVAKELYEFAIKLDFQITVMDSREEFANIERFSNASNIICDSFKNLQKHLVKDAYYVVVTRGHKDDFLCTKTILSSPYTYLGMIGSKSKKAITFERLKKEGISDTQLESIHAPIGLPIKAQTPGEIAISILAEIIQIKNSQSYSSASKELLSSNEPGVLCIIVKKYGSGPRNMGSMMLVTNEKQIDTIGGGTVENEVIQDARNVRHIFCKEYVLNENTTANLGMICGGTIEVLFIPV